MSILIPRHLSDHELREWLIQEIANIDLERRSLKQEIGEMARKPGPLKLKVKKHQELEAESALLFQKREDLRILLGDVNARIKTTNRRINNVPKRDIKLAMAFMTVAEELLDPERFAQIEQQALKIMESNAA